MDLRFYYSQMEPIDPAIQITAVYGWKPILTLVLLAGVGSFFFGALITAIRRRHKDK